MKNLQTKLTTQGQVSVPAAVRKHLHLIPGSVLVWTQEGDHVVVERAKRYGTAEVHQALFGSDAPGATKGTSAAKTLTELKQGVRQYIQRRHASR